MKDGFVKNVAGQRTKTPTTGQKMAKTEPNMGAKHSPKSIKPIVAKKHGRRG